MQYHVPGTSSFTPLEPGSVHRVAGWRASTVGALDGLAFAIPLSLGSTALVFSRVGPDLLASGVFAVMVALVWVHLATARGARPVVFAGRFFEATTLAAMMDQAILRLPAWGLPDTPGVRLAFMCLVVAGAGLCVGALFLVRADRFTRYIPAPVFAGFSNSIAVALLVSQSHMLWTLVTAPGAVAPVLTIAGVVLGTGLAVHRWRPRLPAAAIGLAAGLVLGLAWLAAGHPTPVVSATGRSMTLPFMLADFRSLAQTGVAHWAVAAAIATNAAILGTMIFINTTLASQLMTQSDDCRRPAGALPALWSAITLGFVGAIGSVPLSGSVQSSTAASRRTSLTGHLLLICAAAAAAVYLSGVLAWIPLAALCGALLREAWVTVDLPSVRLLGEWLRGRKMQANQREDLALIAAVTASAVVFNMIAAVFVGLVLGLMLFAARNARRPVRNTWSGSQLHSNCARSRADMRLLAERGSAIKVFELDGDLFFGAVDPLEMELRAGLQDAEVAIVDWSRVRHIDSSVTQMMAKFERQAALRGVPLLHAGADMQAGNVGPELLHRIPGARFVPDLDHALEQAENQLVRLHGGDGPRDATSMLEAVSLFRGLDDAERARLDAAMEQKLFAAGERIVVAGDAGDELMLVLHGSASIIVRSQDGRDVRLAGVRRGATIGEIGFLDHAPRSATVVAEEDVTVAILRRDTYEALCESDPRLVQRLLSNIALDVATRLRHTNRLAIARNGQH